jgi:hypothetical protein
MFVSNGNGYAVPVYTKSASTKETSRKDILDERGTGFEMENNPAFDDLSDDLRLRQVHRVGVKSARFIDTAGEPD